MSQNASRPQLTLLIDTTTRTVVGHRVDLVASDACRVLRQITEPGHQRQWGEPMTILIDGGCAFSSALLRALSEPDHGFAEHGDNKA